MNLSFSTWLRTSNEAKPLRDAFALVDQMPQTFGLKVKTFNAVQAEAEDRWEATKACLSEGAPKN